DGTKLGIVQSISANFSSSLTITTGNGKSVIIGGTGNDTIAAGAGSQSTPPGTGSNIIAGDNAKVTYNAAGKVIQVLSTDASTTEGGPNTITAGDGANRIIAGAGAETVTAGNGANVVIGAEGEIEWTSDGAFLASAESIVPAIAPGLG